MSEVLAGILEFKAGGVPMEVEASFNISSGGIIREGKTGATGGGGYTYMFKIPFFEATLLSVPRGLTPKVLEAIDDETITARLRDGRTYTLYHAWCTQAPDEDPLAGTMGPARFECTPRNVKEIQAAS